MSDIISSAITALTERLGDEIFDGAVKFVIEGIGAIRIDENGVSADDGDADVTLTADVDTFQGIMNGDVNPTSAFMGGKLAVDGDMSMAMKLASVLG